MKCPKCRRTMQDIKVNNSTYWRCNECGLDIGKPTIIPTQEQIDEIVKPLTEEPTIVQEVNDENREAISKLEEV